MRERFLRLAAATFSGLLALTNGAPAQNWVQANAPVGNWQSVASSALGLLFLGSSVTSQAESPPAQTNRTVLQVEPPRSGLQFSTHPTPEEFFRAHVFPEPLVPVGGEPTAAE